MTEPFREEKPGWSKSIYDAHHYLVERWPLIQEKYKKANGHDLFLTCTYRSPATQQALYRLGRTDPGHIVTYIDGVKRLSEHNFYPSRAIDVCVDTDPHDAKVVASWRETLYLALGPICDELDLVWGGSWKRFKDMPHIEMPRDVA